MDKKKKILTIDDSKSVHSFLGACLGDFELHHAMDGKEGLDFVRAHRVPLDLVLLDWEMPVMTGPEVLKALRELPDSPPVIMLTSKNDPENISAMLDLGAQEYVLKPFTQEILLEKISSVLGGL